MFCDHDVIGFDESLNKVAQKSQMDIFVTFWDDITNQRTTRYFTSVFLKSVKAFDLKQGLIESLGITYLTTIILKQFVEADVLGSCTSIKKINLDDANIFLSVRNVDVGFLTKAVLESITKKVVSSEEITNFKTYCRQCYIKMV